MGEKATLEEARRTGRLVRFALQHEPHFSWGGHVLDVGPRWFLLLEVWEAAAYLGFHAFRRRDVRNLAWDANPAFVRAALRARGRRRPRTPSIDVSSVRRVLETAARAFSLVTIHREGKKPNACWIGRVVGVDRTHVSLLQIRPGARWETVPTRYRLSEITRVDVGGEYERSLVLVGGPGPRVGGRTNPRPRRE